MHTETVNKEEMRRIFHERTFRKIVFGDPLSLEDRKLFSQWFYTFNVNRTFFEFYKNKRVLFEVVKSLGNQELIINENIRWLYANKLDYLLYNFFFYKVMEYDGKNTKGDDINGLSLYKGLAHFKERKAPPYNPKEKSEWQEKVWTNGECLFSKSINGYDFALDIDGKDLWDSYADAMKVFVLFKQYGIKFSVQCSGRKGFHFRVPYEEFSDLIGEFDIDKAVLASKGLMLDLVEKLKLKKVDTLIYSSTRYIKCPFSLDARNNRVILPLSDQEFLDFKNNPEKYLSIDYCLSLNNLGYLGEYRGRQSNKQGFLNLIDFLDSQ